MMIIKIFKNEEVIPKTYRVDRFPCCIGRSKFNDVVIDSEGVSFEHCEIIEREDDFILKDRGSTNKLVFETEIRESHVINDGDRIYLGDVYIEFYLEIDEHDKTRVMSISDKKIELKDRIFSSEMFKGFIVILPFLFLSFLYHWIFEFDYEFKNVLSGYFFACLIISPIYLLLIILSKVINGVFQIYEAFRICVMLYTISYIVVKIEKIFSAYFIGKQLVAIVGQSILFFLCVFVIYSLGRVITLRSTRKTILVYAVSVVSSFFMVIFVIEYYIEDKDRHHMTSSIGIPLSRYSTSTNSYDKLWGQILIDFEKIEKMRVEKISERDKYFD